MKPIRLQLSRARGYNLQSASMAANGLPAVKVDRSTRWGNPFIVGKHGLEAQRGPLPGSSGRAIGQGHREEFGGAPDEVEAMAGSALERACQGRRRDATGGEDGSRPEYLLPQIAPESLSRAYDKAAGRAGLPGSLHTLRHTFISHMVMAGVDLPTVQKIAGHAAIVTTLKYVHLAPGHALAAVEKVAL